MWIAIALGPRLSQPLAVMLDRVFIDIALYWIPEATERSRGANSFADVFREIGIAFERFSSLWKISAVAQYFRPAPLCFALASYSPNTLYEAANRAAGFAHWIGKLLEERLGARRATSYTEIVPAMSDACDLVARIDQLTAETEELLRSGDWTQAVLSHRMLLRAQALCTLLARFRQVRTLTYSRLAAAAPF